MKTLPLNLILEKNKLDGQDAWLILLDIVMPNDDAFFLVRNTEDITWNNRLYTAVPFDLDIYKEDSKGAVPELLLTVANQHRIFQAYLEQYEGAVDATMLIRVISVANILEDYAELELSFSVLSSGATSEAITFSLGPPNPFKSRFPQGRFIANHCNFEYKSVECAAVSAFATCNRTLTDCEARENGPRFGGYPGLDKIGIKLV